MASLDYKARLLNVIPGGAHVHSKGYDQFPSNAPQITRNGKGVYVYDGEGQRYLDYGMALRTVIIGYAEEQINRAAIAQIEHGNTSTFPTMIELEAAERLRDLIDSVDMVKFSKDGSTTTTAAVKLARAYTGRKIVARCADQPFFSYDDWFIGTTASPNGCLEETYQFTKLFHYNNIESLELLVDQYPNEIACVILEPALTTQEPENDFLHKLQDLCRRHGIVFILDEMVTGFRWHLKGAQHYYGLTPDLSTFGKAMANGFSVAALGGRREIMELGNIDREDRVFFLSATHGAEMCSLGAFLATLDFLQENGVLEHIWQYGNKLIGIMNETAHEMGISEGFKVTGLGCLPYYVTLNQEGKRDPVLNNLFQREMIKNGVIMRNIHIAFRHGEEELTLTRNALENTLQVYKIAYEES